MTPQIGAFFDLDHTLLSESSGFLYLRYLRQIGYLSWWVWLEVMSLVGLYLTGLCDFPHMAGKLIVRVAGSNENEAWRLTEQWFASMLRDYITAEARRRVAWHQAQGHSVTIVSASTPYAVMPVARELGLGDDYLATRLEVIDGHFTGKVNEPVCYGPGKAYWARHYAERHGLSLAESYFYTDSHHDLPLLELVGHPVAVNPSRKLSRIAIQRNWPIVRFY